MVIERSRVLVKGLANRFGPLPMALAGGLIIGLLTLTIPNSLIERFVSATGISELLSAAAPPLGFKARIAIALATALLSFGVLALLLVRDGDENNYNVIANKKAEDLKFTSDFENEARQKAALSNAALTNANNTTASRKPGMLDRVRNMMPVIRDASPDDIRELEDLPKLRREDRHPDAPPRAPLRAGRDLQNDYDDKALAAAAYENAGGDTGGDASAVANMRKRLGSLIPRDLMVDEDGVVGEMPLVGKKPQANSITPQAPSGVSDYNDPAQNYAAPIAEPVIQKQPASFDAPAAIYVPPVEEPVEESVQETVTEKQVDKAVEPKKSDALYTVADREMPAAKTSRHISAPSDSDHVSLNILNLTELIDRLEKGLDRLTGSAAQNAVQSRQDIAPDANAEQSAMQQSAMKPADMPSQAVQNKASAAPEQEQKQVNDEQPLTEPEDMDEALRAALETLRQMTDDQRNVS